MESGGAERIGFLKGRFDALDAARGAAVVAMIAFHFGWDLSNLRFVVADLNANPVWRWFAHVIAGSFLVIVGIGLVLAHGRAFRPKAFLKRLAVIAGAAAAVTVATVFVFPQSYIFFGILHCIALSSVLALPFLRAPAGLTLIAAAAVLAAPPLLTAPALDAPWLDWLGLGTTVLVTNDYVPIFPWFGLVLIGVATGRLGAGRLATPAERRWRACGLVAQTLVWAGRHSLPIYLLHQVVLFGALSGIVWAFGANPAALEADFLSECETTCRATRDAAVCRPACACARDAIRREGLWAKLMAGEIAPSERSRVTAAARPCFVPDAQEAPAGPETPRP